MGRMDIKLYETTKGNYLCIEVLPQLFVKICWKLPVCASLRQDFPRVPIAFYIVF